MLCEQNRFIRSELTTETNIPFSNKTGAILLSGIGLPLGNEWNLAAGTTEAELFSALEQLFVSPLQAFVCFTLFQLIGSWLIFTMVFKI